MKKATNKLMSFLAAFAMVLSVLVAPFTSANADDATTQKTTKVTLHKLLMTKNELDSWDEKGPEGYDGTQNLEQLGELQSVGKTLNEIPDVFFAVQNSDGKYLAEDGSVASVQEPTAEGFEEAVLGGLTTENGLELNTENLAQDKATEYTIVEIPELSTYKGTDDKGNKSKLLAGSKAVPVKITLPLVNEKGVVTEAHVYPKNTEEKPEIDKNFANTNTAEEVKKDDFDLSTETGEGKNPVVAPNHGADYNNYQKEKARVTAELGKSVPYEVKTKIQAGSKYQTLNWKDTMTNGLTLDANTIQLATNPSLDLTKGTDYKITADDRGFTLSLTETGFKKLNAVTHPEAGAGKNVEFTITYSAKVNKNAVKDIPEKNDVKLEYSNKPSQEKEPTPVTPDKQNGELKVTKTWSGKGENENPEVVYTISNGTINASVMLNGKEKTNKEFDLGNGITFTVTGAYAGTFKGEALKTNNWTIAERVAGYDETINADTSGAAAITNTKDNENPTPLNPSEPEVVYYGKKFVKADKSSGQRLEGAEFVVRNSKNKFLALKGQARVGEQKTALETAKENYTNAIDAWNKAVAENKAKPENQRVADDKLAVTIGGQEYTGKTAVQAKIAELKVDYDKAFKEAANAYEWVDSQDATNVVKLISDVNGKFEISGLEKGSYTLVEVKAPAGYALPTKPEFGFDVDANSYNNGDVQYEGTAPVTNDDATKDAKRVDNQLVTIPQTGGIGSLIFIVAGLALMGVAFVAMKRRNSYEEA
ncbi:pilin N-terminal domain-containing protein [Anaerococcus sp. ENR1011]|uniref:Pilin N-terminal domain-containing protein n=1 Tax=Anaerococcus groningensis TaxID=3115616 RepID=A0ABW9MYY3_9FIRM